MVLSLWKKKKTLQPSDSLDSCFVYCHSLEVLPEFNIFLRFLFFFFLLPSLFAFHPHETKKYGKLLNTRIPYLLPYQYRARVFPLVKIFYLTFNLLMVTIAVLEERARENSSTKHVT